MQGKENGKMSFTQELGPVLNPQMRITKPTELDGNCFFRAIFLALYGCQDHHEQMHKELVQFISTNKEVFAKFCPSETVSLDEHLQLMQQVGCGQLTWRFMLLPAFFSLLYTSVHKEANYCITTHTLYQPQNCIRPSHQETIFYKRSWYLIWK